jgi:NAD(P)H-dependent FMN reductase
LSDTPKILAFAGSLRSGSYNKKLVAIAAAGARQAGAEVASLDLRDLALPVFDQDLEAREGPPPGAVRLKALMAERDALLIASPEYNSSVSAALKNAIDWASRPAPGERSLAAFYGKTAAILSASPGALGGLRGLVHLRAILGNLQVLVLPDQLAVANAAEAFDNEGRLRDAKQQAAAEAIGARLAEITRKLRS